MSVENHEKTRFYKGLEKIIFNEKDFEDLKLIINKLGNGNSNVKQLKRKIINSRVLILKNISKFIAFHLKKQGVNLNSSKDSEITKEAQEKNNFLEEIALRIENLYQKLRFGQDTPNDK